MSVNSKKSFYNFPENMKLFVVALIACNLAVSNFHCNKTEEEPVCPVEYQIITGKNLPLTGKWKFIGFEDIAFSNIEYPPCGETEAFIILTDSLHNRDEKEIFKYPFIFQGRTLINSYIGSYATEHGNKIIFSETIKSKVNGTLRVENFQNKFHDALRTSESFEIENNRMVLNFDQNRQRMIFVSSKDEAAF